jgi:hypothetical protein
MLIQKKANFCLSDKMPSQKKLNLKNCFLIFQNPILDFLIPHMTYFKKKKFNLSEGPFFKFFYTRTKKRKKRQKLKKNAFSVTVLYIFCQSKTT